MIVFAMTLMSSNSPSPQVCFFGAALDALDQPDRVALKQAYAAAAAEGRVPPDLPLDPYDAIVRAFSENGGLPGSLLGKLPLPGWLTPRPGPEWADKIQSENFRSFLDRDSCREAAGHCQALIAKNILPAVPGLLAVDHSLAGGAIAAVTEKDGPENVTVIVLDSHFDGLPNSLRKPAADSPAPDTYHCGSFLHYLLEEGRLLPQNLIVIGVSDYPGADASRSDPLVDAYLGWADRGVAFFPKSQVRLPGFSEVLAEKLDAVATPYLYISLDADVGACAGIPAVRFMDRVGLEAKEILPIAEAIGARVHHGRARLAGFDVSELDVHLLGLEEEDFSIQTCLDFIGRLLEG